MDEWTTIDGETPIDPSGLKKRGSIRNRADLAVAEARNINKALLKYLASKPQRSSARFDYPWFLKLHKEMFGDVWTWAGAVRAHDLSLGVPHFQVTEQLARLVGDLESWSGFGHPMVEQAAWLHHKAVQIHSFENGNGRWSRLLSNIWLKLNDHPIIVWPDRLIGQASEIRSEYLDAIKRADRGEYGPLLAMHHKYLEES